MNTLTVYKNLLPIILVALSPLVRLSVQDSNLTRNTWSWQALIACTLIVFYGLNQYRVRIKNMALGLIFFLIITFSSLIEILPQRPTTLLFYTIIIAIGVAVWVIKIHHTYAKKLMLIFTCCISLYSQWGIAQFITQHDLGLQKINETRLRVSERGLASFYTPYNKKFLRAYGPFGHSNSLGGVLALGILVTTYVATRTGTEKRDRNFNIFMYSILFSLILGIAVSFSRTALISITIPLLYLLAKTRNRKIMIIVFIPIIVFAPLFLYRTSDPHGVAASDRIEGASWAMSMATPKSLLRGYGIGNYTSALSQHLLSKNISHNAWDVAPVHSVPILVISELGIILSLVLFFSTTYILRHSVWIFLLLTPMLFFDHYFLTQFGPLTWLTACVIILHRVY